MVLTAAITRNDTLYFSISAKSEWSGNVIFDTPRHKTVLNMPYDWPRINQFPEWFTVDKDQIYLVINEQAERRIRGNKMAEGIRMNIGSGNHLFVTFKL